ncbi:flagellar biosynthetic protein FliR [bacterium]|nr:flagellar biosynthetic protein FliR [candidate division CSSED10-310 bacterium]
MAGLLGMLLPGHGISLSTHILLAGLLLIRLATAVFFAPFLGGKIVPVRIKMSVALGLTVVVYPQVSASLHGTLEMPGLVYPALLVKEGGIGLMMGFIIGLVFHAAEAAGGYLDTMRGLGSAVLMAPQTGGQVSLLGNLYLQLAIVLLFAWGGHLPILQGLLGSFELLPPLQFVTWSDSSLNTAAWFAAFSARLFSTMLLIVAPPLITVMLTEVILALMNRMTPQINVFMLGLPLKTMIALVVLLLGLDVMADKLRHEVLVNAVMLDRFLDLAGG